MIERLDQFMARANEAYYANCDPFADFTTSPELSQVFGELLGLWAALVWQAMGAPADILLVEAGAGRATMIGDALRAVRRAVPGFADTLSLHLIENSPRLGAIARSRMPQAQIHSDLALVPSGPMIFLANEFLDALPIRQFVRRSAGWMERHVDDHKFVEIETDIALPDCDVGAIREWGEAAENFVADLSARLVRQGGAGLIIDYGPARTRAGDSVQAIRDGKFADPLVEPGTADLTAHVDFETLSGVAVAAGASVAGPIPQGAFLAALGIHERTAQLGRMAEPEAALNLLVATRRMTAPEEMGDLFKALAVHAPALPSLPGFLA